MTRDAPSVQARPVGDISIGGLSRTDPSFTDTNKMFPVSFPPASLKPETAITLPSGDHAGRILGAPGKKVLMARGPGACSVVTTRSSLASAAAITISIRPGVVAMPERMNANRFASADQPIGLRM